MIEDMREGVRHAECPPAGVALTGSQRSMNEVLQAAGALPDHADDLALARGAAGGDRAAFTGLMRRYNRRLFRLARAALRDDAEAEDALQEAYIAVYRSIGQYRGEASLSTWLSRVVLNECRARLRKGVRRQNVFPIVTSDEMDTMVGDESGRPDRAFGRSEMRALIERKLDQLPDEYRMAFMLRAIEEFTVEEAAACLGIPEATVRSRHFRAKSLLRESLAREIDTAERDLYEFGGARCDCIVERVNARLDREGQTYNRQV